MSRADRDRSILDAAAQLFSERGYQGTTMDDIAAAVSLNKGTLYHYVVSKADLLARICGESVDDILRLFGRIDPALSPPDAVRQIIVDLLRELARRPHHTTVYLQEMHWIGEWLPGPEVASLRARESLLHLHVVEAIEAGIRSGEFRTSDASVAALGLIGMVSWTYHWYRSDGRRSIDEVADVYAELMLRGLRSGSPPA